MKKNYIIAFLITSFIGWAQIPPGYYDSAIGSGYTLKTQLKSIITANHNDQGYAALMPLYTTTAFRDNYYENDGSLLDIYSERPTSSDPYNYTSTSQQCGNYSSEGDCYNREHLVPQSYFDNFLVDPMKNDAFHVVPSDGKVNGDRNNLPFGKVNTVNYTSQNGSKRGSNTINGFSSYNGTVFEPIDEFKGDIARIYFYFITRYETQVTNWNYDMFNGTSDQVLTDTCLYTLLDWHCNDPVSQKEINQNNAIFAHQNNRNPYIDHPEFICQIYPTQCTQIANLSTNSFATNYISVYPNPSNNGNFTINSTEDLTRIVIYNINGQLIQEVNNPSKINDNYEITGLASGFYFLELNNNSAKQIKKIIVN